MKAVTPEEAKELWCPFVNIGPKSEAKSNRSYGCISESCMAWNWTEQPGKSGPNRVKTPLIGEAATNAKASGYKQVAINGDFIIWERSTMTGGSTGRGYCGLMNAGSIGIREIGETTRESTRQSVASSSESTIITNERGEKFDLAEIAEMAGV